MATFLPACHGQRVKAVVRRRGYRPITRTFDKPPTLSRGPVRSNARWRRASSPTSAPQSAYPCAG
jgi:hypothetical protein